MNVLALRRQAPCSPASSRFTRRTTESAPDQKRCHRPARRGGRHRTRRRRGTRPSRSPQVRCPHRPTGHPHQGLPHRPPRRHRRIHAPVRAVLPRRRRLRRRRRRRPHPAHRPRRRLALPGLSALPRRRSCPPAGPVDLGLYEDARLEDVLRSRGRPPPGTADAAAPRGPSPCCATRAADEPATTADILRDQPVSFDAAHRRHAPRTVLTVPVPTPMPAGRGGPRDAHDPFAALAALDVLEG
ncbi:type I-E CRISPR-associated protein Cas5/CasD [Streptomyces hirsutus]